jgi:hypothetical protein
MPLSLDDTSRDLVAFFGLKFSATFADDTALDQFQQKVKGMAMGLGCTKISMATPDHVCCMLLGSVAQSTDKRWHRIICCEFSALPSTINLHSSLA